MMRRRVVVLLTRSRKRDNPRSFAGYPAFSEATLVTLQEWIKDWRSIVQRLKTDDKYIPIKAMHAGSAYEILRIARYSAAIDGDQPYVSTSVRAFDDSTGFYTHRTRDTGMGRFITKGSSQNRCWVLEPGEDLMAYNAAKECVSESELVRLTKRSKIGRTIVRDLKDTERKRQALLKSEHDQEVREISEVTAMIAEERNHAQHELARRGME